MKKQILSFLLALFLLLGMLPTNVNAVADSGSCGDNVFWNYANRTLTVSGHGPMDDYAYSTSWGSPPWDAYRNDITTVYIQNGVSYIGADSFEHCEFLTSVSIPDSVISIGSDAFKYCSSLISINIPDSVTSIESSAFQYCDSLTSITIPGSVRTIAGSTFSNCLNLKTVRISEGVNRIESSAFNECVSLENVSLPRSLRSIYSFAFDDCTALHSITFPENVDRIENFAFEALSSVVFQGDAPAQFEDYSLGSTFASPIVALYPSYRNWPQSFLSEHNNIRWKPYSTPIDSEPPETEPPVIYPPVIFPPETLPPVTEPPISTPPSNLPSITGTYTTDLIFPAADLGMPSYIADSIIRATLVFANDGKVSMTWQAINLTALRLYFYDLFRNAYYAMAYGAGITDFNEIEQFCINSTGMSVDAYVKSIVTHNAMVAAFTPAPTSGTYAYNDDHTALSTDMPIMNVSSHTSILNTFTIDGNTLYLNAASYGKPEYTFVCTRK